MLHAIAYSDLLVTLLNPCPWHCARFSGRRKRLRAIMRVHRAIKELSQARACLSKPARLSQTISAIESRSANPTLDTLGKIAHALGVEVDALFGKPERGR